MTTRYDCEKEYGGMIATEGGRFILFSDHLLEKFALEKEINKQTSRAMIAEEGLAERETDAQEVILAYNVQRLRGNSGMRG